jgi:heat shock protein HtpX
MAAIDESKGDAAKLRNALHSALLIAGIGLTMSLCAYLLWGRDGLIWPVLAMAIVVFFAPRIVMSGPMRGREMLSIMQELARRAELTRAPRLFVVPSPTLNAFATGARDNAVIAVTEGLLRKLTLREMAGVLGHEMAHVRNNDLWVMSLADVMTRFTRVMSLVSMAIAILQIPSVLSGDPPAIPWFVILLLYLAPAIASLLQLALSRSREYDADLVGARLTGDPDGLVLALAKLERYQGQMWEDVLLPSRRIPQPSVLRSHPPTEERIARLRALKIETASALRVPEVEAMALGLGVLPRAPRYHWSGYWY